MGVGGCGGVWGGGVGGGEVGLGVGRRKRQTAFDVFGALLTFCTPHPHSRSPHHHPCGQHLIPCLLRMSQPIEHAQNATWYRLHRDELSVKKSRYNRLPALSRTEA